jgi:hypothetical protein
LLILDFGFLIGRGRKRPVGPPLGTPSPSLASLRALAELEPSVPGRRVGRDADGLIDDIDDIDDL